MGKMKLGTNYLIFKQPWKVDSDAHEEDDDGDGAGAGPRLHRVADRVVPKRNVPFQFYQFMSI